MMSSYSWNLLVDTVLRDPLPGMLKLYADLVGWLSPWVGYILIGYLMTWVGASERVRKTVRRLMIPVMWFGALNLLNLAMSTGEGIWISNHSRQWMTEEEAFPFPDGPNLFAGWILTGWLIVAVGYLATQTAGLSRRSKTPAFLTIPATR